MVARNESERLTFLHDEVRGGAPRFERQWHIGSQAERVRSSHGLDCAALPGEPGHDMAVIEARAVVHDHADASGQAFDNANDDILSVDLTGAVGPGTAFERQTIGQLDSAVWRDEDGLEDEAVGPVGAGYRYVFPFWGDAPPAAFMLVEERAEAGR